MGTFFDVLNTPIAAPDVLVVAVGVNAFLYLGHGRSEASAERGEWQTTVQTTERRADPGEATRPATTLLSTTPTVPSATSSP